MDYASATRTRAPARSGQWIVAALRRLALPAAVGLPLCLYVWTLAPTVYNLDSAELATAGATAGIAHPPGYPLYVLIARAFVLVPVGDVGYRVNLLSALCAGVALVFVFLLVRRVTRSAPAAVAATWLLGLAYPFWSDAVVAEVYMLDAALVAAMLYLLVRGEQDGSEGSSALGFLVLGLSLANRVTNVLALPAVVIFRAPAWRRRPRRLLIDIAAIIPGVALYAWLPLRSALGGGYRWGSSYAEDGRPIPIDITTPHDIWWYVSARAFAPFAHWYTPSQQIDEARRFGSDAWAALVGAGVILAVAGFASLSAHRPRIALLLLTVALPQALFFISYAVVDKDTMFANTYLVIAIFAGCGYAAAEHGLRSSGLPWPRLFLGAGAVLVAASLIYTNTGLLDLRDDYRARDQSNALMRDAEPGALVIGTWTAVAPLEYMQDVEHRRPDLALVQGWVFGFWGPNDLVQYAIAHGRPVYIDDLSAIDTAGIATSRTGNWYRLRGSDSTNQGVRP